MLSDDPKDPACLAGSVGLVGRKLHFGVEPEFHLAASAAFDVDVTPLLAVLHDNKEPVRPNFQGLRHQPTS